eukprot:TRINITY_DN19628_c0_g1_i1.p1 TRINITY_DN19628_c0_g1~~TRINITY_DN19628_c0_g1_i1.p1  ORF type:complete len:470 (+),score=147.92 TRINITY_DN19628_c0_g1_i1:70-1479(+)
MAIVGVGAQGQGLISMLEAYDVVKKECLRLVDSEVPGVEDDSIQTVLDSLEREVTDPERELAVELSKLSGCEQGLRKLAAGLQLGQRRGSSLAKSTVIDVDDVIAGLAEEERELHQIAHPFKKGKMVPITQLDIEECTQKAGMFPSTVVQTLVEAKAKLEQLLMMQERRHALETDKWAASEADLRDQFFIARRQILAKSAQIKKFEALGFAAVATAADDAAAAAFQAETEDDMLEQYTAVKDKVKRLQQELREVKDREAVLAEKVETLTKGYRTKCFEVSRLEKSCQQTAERLAEKTSQHLEQKHRTDELTQEVRTASHHLAGVLSGAVGMGLGAMAKAIEHGTTQLRMFLRDPTVGLQATAADHAFTVDVARVAQLLVSTSRNQPHPDIAPDSPPPLKPLSTLPSLYAAQGGGASFHQSFHPQTSSSRLRPKAPDVPGSPRTPRGRAPRRLGSFNTKAAGTVPGANST